jgi:hypothetical protein
MAEYRMQLSNPILTTGHTLEERVIVKHGKGFSHQGKSNRQAKTVAKGSWALKGAPLVVPCVCPSVATRDESDQSLGNDRTGSGQHRSASRKANAKEKPLPTGHDQCSE